MDAPTRRLRLLLRIWLVVFGLGALDFLVFPTLTVRILNAAGKPFQLAPLEAGYQFWSVLAVAYMVLIAAFCLEATRERDRVTPPPVRFLLLAKATSSLVSLVFFILAVRAFAFLANFVVDGGIALITYWFYRQAVGPIQLRGPA
ncbi:MAG: hypothetical protein E6I70_01290 [Chloroflexi bacterium]|nr:MAG: hypothetical protein E6I70_01290 [Chloroflexota bacterium]